MLISVYEYTIYSINPKLKTFDILSRQGRSLFAYQTDYPLYFEYHVFVQHMTIKDKVKIWY